MNSKLNSQEGMGVLGILFIFIHKWSDDYGFYWSSYWNSSSDFGC